MTAGRFLPLLLLTASCALLGLGGPSEEDRKSAQTHLENARSYLAGNRLDQAEHQVQMGLSLAPENYYLKLMRGRIYLLRAKDDADFYPRAVTYLQEAQALRSRGAQDYRSFIHLGEALQGLATAHFKESRFLAAQARKEGLSDEEKEDLLARAGEQKGLCRKTLARAEEQFRHLLRSGESALQANRFLFLLANEKVAFTEEQERMAQIRKALDHGEAYLKEVLGRLEHYRRRESGTGNLELEQAYRLHRREYELREKECRSTLHGLYARAGRMEKALEHLDAIIAEHPDDAAERYHRGIVNFKLGNREQARADLLDFMRLTRLPYESRQVTRAREMLGKLKP